MESRCMIEIISISWIIIHQLTILYCSSSCKWESRRKNTSLLTVRQSRTSGDYHLAIGSWPLTCLPDSWEKSPTTTRWQIVSWWTTRTVMRIKRVEKNWLSAFWCDLKIRKSLLGFKLHNVLRSSLAFLNDTGSGKSVMNCSLLFKLHLSVQVGWAFQALFFVSLSQSLVNY